MKRTNRGCVIITRRKMPARNCETERGGEEGALGVLFKSRNEEQRRTDNEEIGDSCVKSETESQASNPCSSRGGVRVPKNSFTSVVERKKKKNKSSFLDAAKQKLLSENNSSKNPMRGRKRELTRRGVFVTERLINEQSEECVERS